MTSYVVFLVGLVFTGFGAYHLVHPRLEPFAEAGLFPRDEVGPAERTLGRIAAAGLLLVGLFFLFIGL